MQGNSNEGKDHKSKIGNDKKDNKLSDNKDKLAKNSGSSHPRHSFVIAGKIYPELGTTFTVEERYELLKQIGLGAYGVVCSCQDKKTNMKVAIKKVPNAFEDLVDAKRILREIKLLKYFDHENIISLLDVPKPEAKTGYNDIYIVTDLMETDLHRVIYSKQVNNSLK